MAKAETPALSALLGLLDAEQRRGYLQEREFEFITSSGKRVRLDADDYQGNIVWLDKLGRPHRRWCAHVQYGGMQKDAHFTWGDHRAMRRDEEYVENRVEAYAKHHLAQYLMLKTNDAAFFAIAL